MSENKNFFHASAEDFKKIPGSPVAYWVSGAMMATFGKGVSVDSLSDFTGSQHKTADNERFLRSIWEVSLGRVKSQDWLFYIKGGEFRKWYGNIDLVVNWTDSAKEFYKTNPTSNMLAERYWQKEGVTYTSLSTGKNGFRYLPPVGVFDIKGPSLINVNHLEYCLSFFNSPVAHVYFKLFNATMTLQVKDVKSVPLIIDAKSEDVIQNSTKELISIAQADWDSYETSWDFTVNSLAAARNVSEASDKSAFQLSALYAAVRATWAKNCEEMRRLETENNRIFIEAYGLQDELTPEVPWHEITLTCNPWYRYGVKSGQCLVDGDQSAVDTSHSPLATSHSPLSTSHSPLATINFPLDTPLEERLREDTVKELISYAVGCMMGRYSLEKPGLILADQGAQVSDRWIVVSGQLVLKEKVVDHVRKELQRIDCLAEGDGSCGRSVSTGETAPDGGTVCIIGSASSGGGFNSVECRRGAGTEHDSGLRELSDNGSRVVLRDGNAVVDLCSSEVLDAIASGSGAELVRRGWKDAERIDWKTIHSSLTTNHFSPDEDGIIPILDNNWFADDIVTRFKDFIKVAFGEEHFFENMAWIEDALGKDIRSYFTKDFYKDHLQRYQNRPIYWLFQSPKGAFRALVYMHRYKPDMVGGVLGYLRSLQTKVDNQLDVAMQVGADESKSASERVRANKDAVKYAKAKKELDEYEKNVLYPLSTERIEIDLDDGVKVNYKKFGAALAKVKALEGKGE